MTNDGALGEILHSSLLLSSTAQRQQLSCTATATAANLAKAPARAGVREIDLVQACARPGIGPVVEQFVHLYRVMTEVCAGPAQRNCQPGQTGLATVWVRSNSDDDALLQARSIIEARRYHSVGELTVYLEHTHGSPSGGAGEEDPLAAGYTTMKEKALGSGDGLFEIWFPAK